MEGLDNSIVKYNLFYNGEKTKIIAARGTPRSELISEIRKILDFPENEPMFFFDKENTPILFSSYFPNEKNFYITHKREENESSEKNTNKKEKERKKKQEKENNHKPKQGKEKTKRYTKKDLEKYWKDSNSKYACLSCTMKNKKLITSKKSKCECGKRCYRKLVENGKSIIKL